MAGDWIPMRMDLLDDPAVIAIAASVGLDEYAVVGRLLKLWSWANRHLKDGRAFVPDKWVDDYTGTTGFAAAMLHAGWLRTRSGGGLEFTSFDRWNSNGAKIRLGETIRKRAFREKKAGGGSVPNVSRTNTDGSPGPEKRREEKSKDTPQPPDGGGVLKSKPAKAEHPHFAAFWAAYPRKEAKANAVKAFASLNPDAELLATLLEAIDRQRRRGGCLEDRTTGDGRSTIPHPATWLNGRRWEDLPPQSGRPATPTVSSTGLPYEPYENFIPKPGA